MLVSLLALAALFLAPPSIYRVPPCPSLFLTGLYCPGCGSLRAVHHLLHGHLLRAVGFNPLFILLLPYLAAWWLAEAWVALRGWRPRLPMSPIFGGAILVLVLGFWVARNLPVAACAVLRPVAENPLLAATAGQAEE
jgi:hypothetical protein